METPQRLLILYDEECALCRRCRHWLEGQETHVPLEFLAAQSAAARERYGEVPWLGADLVVVDDQGNVWAGPAAFLMCLWATVDYRVWSYRLSGRALAPLAERFFHLVSANRRRIGAVVGSKDCPDGRCGHRADEAEPRMAQLGSHRDRELAPAGPAGWAPPPPPKGAIRTCRACGAPVWRKDRRCWSCGTTR
jgi:predicted DCC family thiol-disulfide oxidoreductase YuxK